MHDTESAWEVIKTKKLQVIHPTIFDVVVQEYVERAQHIKYEAPFVMPCNFYKLVVIANVLLKRSEE